MRGPFGGDYGFGKPFGQFEMMRMANTNIGQKRGVSEGMQDLWNFGSTPQNSRGGMLGPNIAGGGGGYRPTQGDRDGIMEIMNLLRGNMMGPNPRQNNPMQNSGWNRYGPGASNMSLTSARMGGK